MHRKVGFDVKESPRRPQDDHSMTQNDSFWALELLSEGQYMHDFEMQAWELGPGMEAPPCVIDLRTAEQYSRGHIPHSVHLSYNQFQADAPELVSDFSWVLLVDEGGARAAEMAVWLRARGAEARYLVGGMSKWRGPLEKS